MLGTSRSNRRVSLPRRAVRLDRHHWSDARHLRGRALGDIGATVEQQAVDDASNNSRVDKIVEEEMCRQYYLGFDLPIVIVRFGWIWTDDFVDSVGRSKETITKLMDRDGKPLVRHDVHIDDGNVAVGLRRAGLYLGIAIALSGALGGASRGILLDLIQLLLDGLIITGFMFSSRFINDFFMLGNINNDNECIKTFELANGTKIVGNTAVGMVEAGMYIATGFILNGAISGSGGTFY